MESLVLLTPQDLAERLRYSRRTIADRGFLARSGLIKATVRVGGALRFDSRAVDRILTAKLATTETQG